MAEQDSDPRLRRLFEELRRADERATPAFARVLAGPPERRWALPRSVAPRTLAVGLLLVVAGLLPLTWRRSAVPAATPAPVNADFVAWRSPTAGLLLGPRELPLAVGVSNGYDDRMESPE